MRRSPSRCQVPCREAATPWPRHNAALPTSISGACPHPVRGGAGPLKHHPIRTVPPDHPASSVRSVGTFGSPSSCGLLQSCSGARYRRSARVDSLAWTLVGLAPQSKRFFRYLGCRRVMPAVSTAPSACLLDRGGGGLAQAHARQKQRRQRRPVRTRARRSGRRRPPAGAPHQPQ